MFMVGFTGTMVDDNHWIARAVQDEDLGGVILFDRNVDGSVQNISSPAQLQELTATLQAYSAVPLLISTDQEGGQVCRLKERDGFLHTESAKTFARLDREGASESSTTLVEALVRGGINLNLAPVVDLDLNPNNPIIGRYQRSFAAEPEEVFQNAQLVIKAHHRHNIGCCLKHFPGHGSAAADSHLGFVDSTVDWQEKELEPFARLIRSGFSDAIMTAHVINRRLDPQGMPATLSRPIASDLLRGRLGFTGVTVSDDLQMKAITKKWGYSDAVRLAVLAGVDLLIVGNNLDAREGAFEEGKRCVQDMLDRGEVSADYIQTSLKRIATLKKKISGEQPWKNSEPTTLS